MHGGLEGKPLWVVSEELLSGYESSVVYAILEWRVLGEGGVWQLRSWVVAWRVGDGLEDEATGTGWLGVVVCCRRVDWVGFRWAVHGKLSPPAGISPKFVRASTELGDDIRSISTSALELERLQLRAQHGSRSTVGRPQNVPAHSEE